MKSGLGSEELVKKSLIQIKQSETYLWKLKLGQLQQLQAATEQYILEDDDLSTEEMNDILRLNEQVKLQIQHKRHDIEKMKKEQQFKETHSSIVEDFMQFVSNVGPQAPFGQKGSKGKKVQQQ